MRGRAVAVDSLWFLRVHLLLGVRCRPGVAGQVVVFDPVDECLQGCVALMVERAKQGLDVVVKLLTWTIDACSLAAQETGRDTQTALCTF